jgi:hypothetical protein
MRTIVRAFTRGKYPAHLVLVWSLIKGLKISKQWFGVSQTLNQRNMWGAVTPTIWGYQ